MSCFECPFCSASIPITPYTAMTQAPSFEHANGFYTINGLVIDDESKLHVSFFKCPKCNEYSISIKGVGTKVADINTRFIRPLSLAKKFPEYVPASIRQDYEEACAIVNLSPKASATLSRRCLQAMIRDFWQVSGKNRLIDEIDTLQDKVPATQWAILNSLRRIGNIGAHPEADVNLIIDIEPEDAQKLVSVIKLLIEQWYIERHEQEQLYADILAIDEDTKLQKIKG